MKFFVIKTPHIVKLLFWNWIWDFSQKEKVIYLTFDDGPTPDITEWTLDQLKRYRAKATFFCIGNNSSKYPEIHREIIANGHAIGNHTQNHLNGWYIPTSTYLKNIEEAQNILEKNHHLNGTEFHRSNNQQSKLFRPPYGKLTLSQSKKLRKKGYKIIMWDVISADFDPLTSGEKCLQNVIGNTNNGSIIVFHDSFKAAEKLRFVLPKILDYYTSIGYEFRKIS